MATAFALVSALLAAFTMGALETRLLDEGAYSMGVGIAAVVGFVVAHVAQMGRFRGRRHAALAVVVAGALVGMAIQTVLLVRLPPFRTYFMSPWVTSKDTLSWILIGAPLGILPAIGAALLFLLGIQLATSAGRPAPKDAPERVLVPIAGSAAVLAAFGVAHARADELVVVVIVMAVACGALLQVVRVDRARMRWLQDVFEARDAAFGVTQLEESPPVDLPLVVGGLVPGAVITQLSELGTYRSSPAVRYGAAAFTFEATVRPLARRIRVARAVAGFAPICAALAALAR